MTIEELRNNSNKNTTTIAIWKSTKDKLDRNRAPGQCYNGFICQLVDLWEESSKERVSTSAVPSGGNQGAVY
ncbi:hypothetical protein ACFLY3_03120 [Chloroflexota bacterium]